MTPDASRHALDNGPAAVVAHFDARGEVHSDLMNTLRVLHARGMRLCLVSTGLNDAAAQAVSAWAHVIRRDNLGYDFWSYKVGIDWLREQGGMQRLLLFNSSIYIDDAQRLLERMDRHARQVDLLAMTLSHEVRPHLQSFWLSFENAAILASDAFKQWWSELKPLSVREEVIAEQELGLSAHFARAGFSLGAMFQPNREQQLRAVARALENGFLPLQLPPDGPVSIDPAWADRLNPTMYAWDALWEQLGVLKWELLLRNPHRLNLEPLRAHPRLRGLLG